jgi:tRNA(Ile)-lysidine synthetase-like protein
MAEYQDILTYWFQDYTIIPKFWFDKNSKTDDYIIDKFKILLTKAENHELNHWKVTSKGHLALIILLDQFSRHIYRDTNEQYKNDLIAYYYAIELFLEKKDDDLNTLELMIALMPFRHQEKLDPYEFAINYIKDKTDPIWDKFKFHTVKNYEYLKEHGKLPTRDDTYKIDWNKFNDILETPWNFQMQTYDIESELTNTLINYLTNIIPDKNNIIIVSLSGGVDSMVILFLLTQIQKRYNNLEIVAIHIDYHNRYDTGLEAEFIFNYCDSMKIPLYYRYIHEGVRERNSRKREEYEELTKNIRFDLYKKVEDLYKTKNNMLGVILGHHKGDLQENIFQNVMKGRNLTDLSVIKEQSEILGVKILRLLIRHPKSDIFQMAHKNNIPYFKNTTPIWSNRGQLREIVIPSIIKTFGEGVLTNLTKAGQESDDLQLIMKEHVINPYIKTIKSENNIHYLVITPNQSFTYWKYIFHEWCHLNKIPVFSYKLIGQIYEKIYLNTKVSITCNQKISMLINNNYIIINVKV